MTTAAREAVLFRPWPKQQYLLDLIWRERTAQVLYGGAAGGGKALDITIPIPTPSGWRAMGDLVAGDEVFDEYGRVIRVGHAFAPFLAESYRLTFDDGTTVDACADHQWLTFDAREMAALTRRTTGHREARKLRRASRATGLRSALFTAAITERNRQLPPPTLDAPAGAVRTTLEIVATLRTASGRTNHAVPVAGALELPDVDLPLDPYLLGVWLGDGSKADGSITTMDDEVEAAFAAGGFPPGKRYTRPGRAWGFTPRRLAIVLRSLGVIGDKHIPAAYLRASRDQRLALLQGLMDTDGTVADSGKPEFTNTNKAIVDAVYELIVSLGWKARVVEGVAKLDGRYIGPKWDIKWSPDDYVFRLTRKRDRQVLATRRTTRFRYIVDAQPIEPVVMRCISVDSPGHLYLAGRSMVPTHNSQIVRILATTLAVKWPGARIGIFRRTDQELQANHVNKWLEEVDPYIAGGRFFQQKMEYHFPSPAWCWCPKGEPCAHSSVVAFRHVDDNRGARKQQGNEYAAELLDEATHFRGPDIDFLYTRVRPGNKDKPRDIVGPDGATYRYPGWPDYLPLQLLTANPGDVGEAYMIANYIDPENGLAIEGEDALPKRIVDGPHQLVHPIHQVPVWEEQITVPVELEDPDAPPSYEQRWQRVDMRGGRTWAVEIILPSGKVVKVKRAFIPSRLEDNPSLDPDEYAASLSVGSKENMRRLLEGDWTYSEDRVFKVLTRDTHLVQYASIFGDGPPPFDLMRGIGLDAGTAKPTAAIWVCLEDEGFFIAYREYYSPGGVAKHVREIREIMDWDGHPDLRPQADPQMWRLNQSRGDDAISVAALYAFGGDPPDDPVERRMGMGRGINLVQSKVSDAAALAELESMLEPDPERLFPSWHARYGQYGAPLLFIADTCPNLWREMTMLKRPSMEADGAFGEGLKNGQPDHAFDAFKRIAGPLRRASYAGKMQRNAPRLTIGYR